MEFYHSLARTFDVLQREIEELLKSNGLSEPQYSVLCVLEKAHPEALSCGDIAAGMISRDPDITRLLDRLERCGFIERRRGSPDRRLVSVNILEPGLALVAAVRGPLEELHQRQFAVLELQELEVLNERLARLRTRLESTRPPDRNRVSPMAFSSAS
jgi:DNA-binding MarR family transcriptional regulator